MITGSLPVQSRCSSSVEHCFPPCSEGCHRPVTVETEASTATPQLRESLLFYAQLQKSLKVQRSFTPTWKVCEKKHLHGSLNTSLLTFHEEDLKKIHFQKYTLRGSAQNHAVTIETAANHNTPQRPCYKPQHLVFSMGGEQWSGLDFTALSRPSFSNANSGRQKDGKQLSSSAGVVKKCIKPWLK